MAGFAVFFTIAILGILGLVLASVSSVVLYCIARRRTQRGVSTRRAAIVGALSPFLGLLWVIVAFVIHVQVSNRIAHQDCGLSGDPYVTLPNGDVLGSLNTYDGYFKAPGAETDVPIAGPGYVRSIIHLEYSEPYFIGTQFDFTTSSVRRFVFDTRTRAFQASELDGPHHFDPSSKEAMDAWTNANTHAQTDPDSYWRLYKQYRRRWPTYIFIVIIAAGETGIIFGVWRSWSSRRVAGGDGANVASD